MEADLLKQKEAIDAAKREHELEDGLETNKHINTLT